MGKDIAQNTGGKTSARSRPGLIRRFLRNSSGSTAIEFTALALPFSALIFAILESCISFAGQQVLSNATDNVARQLRTGQVKAADINANKLKKMICDQINVIVAEDCPGLVFDLRAVDTFAQAAALGLSLNETRDDIKTVGFGVTPGKSLSKNVLRVYYKWPVMTDFMRYSMSNLKDGKTLHFATATWQNEPFDD